MIKAAEMKTFCLNAENTKREMFKKKKVRKLLVNDLKHSTTLITSILFLLKISAIYFTKIFNRKEILF